MVKYALVWVILLMSINKSVAQTNRRLIWSDEFNYTGLPDSAKWTFEKGVVRNKEPQYYTAGRSGNCKVENGCLVIEAKKENYKGCEYTSASITTQHKMDFRYGRVEMRARVPKGTGCWPAFWMLGADHGMVKWPDCGEIDIMGFVGRDSSRVYGTVHYANDLDKYEHRGANPVVGAPYDGFHIYAIGKTKSSISFYYDSLKYFVFDLTKAAKKTKKIFDKPFYVLINLALGKEGTLGGRLDDSILPIKYYVDYVRVYKRVMVRYP